MSVESRSTETVVPFAIQPEPLPTNGSHSLFQFRSAPCLPVITLCFICSHPTAIGRAVCQPMFSRLVPTYSLTTLHHFPSPQIALTARRPFGIKIVRLPEKNGAIKYNSIHSLTQTTVYSSQWWDLFWTLFVPTTVFRVKYVDCMEVTALQCIVPS